MGVSLYLPFAILVEEREETAMGFPNGTGLACPPVLTKPLPGNSPVRSPTPTINSPAMQLNIFVSPDVVTSNCPSRHPIQKGRKPRKLHGDSNVVLGAT